MTLNPGESIRYVITENTAAVPSDRARAWEFLDGSWAYDVGRYTELFLRAVETVLQPFGINENILRNWLAQELPAEHMRSRLEAPRGRPYLGPLFEWPANQPNASSVSLVRPRMNATGEKHPPGEIAHTFQRC